MRQWRIFMQRTSLVMVMDGSFLIVSSKSESALWFAGEDEMKVRDAESIEFRHRLLVFQGFRVVFPEPLRLLSAESCPNWGTQIAIRLLTSGACYETRQATGDGGPADANGARSLGGSTGNTGLAFGSAVGAVRSASSTQAGGAAANSRAQPQDASGAAAAEGEALLADTFAAGPTAFAVQEPDQPPRPSLHESPPRGSASRLKAMFEQRAAANASASAPAADGLRTHRRTCPPAKGKLLQDLLKADEAPATSHGRRDAGFEREPRILAMAAT
ncbi:unnamed protein product [Prorocentrum cordatum]|uniref:PH domain-containing protein n=1 Tax=Prorocentrum cordatum TaxID=2364126 RepID=A0ABN9SPB7_9DINO|nr:unnamed protein product [Polarella glacialis]